MLLLVVCLGHVQGVFAHESMWRLSTYMFLCVMMICLLYISLCVCLSTRVPPPVHVSVCAVSIGVSVCPHVPGGRVYVISMLDVCTTQRVNSRETESARELMRTPQREFASGS